MSTVSTLLDYIKDDIKESSTDRDAELMRYMNRVINKGIVPTLIRFRSTIGLTEWYTDEVTENVRTVALPASFLAMHTLYCVDSYHDGTSSAGTNTTITLESGASTSNDTYNSMNVRIYGGTGDGQQKVITDYVGSTLVATVNSAWSTNPDATSTYIVFEQPTEGDELTQREIDFIRSEYNDTGAIEAYAIEGTNMILGNIPDSTTRVLQGWYWATPTLLSATGNTVPFNGFFDWVIVEYVSMRALNRDEYNVQMEMGLIAEAVAGVTSIIRLRKSKTDRQPKISGSEDL